MWETILGIVVKNVLEIVAAIISVLVAGIVIPWIKTEMVPFLKEKRLYNIVSIGVNAAEKLAEGTEMSGFDKKQYVIRYLTSKGIVITEEVEAFIESACHDLDLITDAGKEAFDEEDDVEGDEPEDNEIDNKELAMG